MMNPLIANTERPQRKDAADGDNDCFKGRVRCERGANRAVTKAQQENIDEHYIGIFIPFVNF
jgi:hypothetical protein